MYALVDAVSFYASAEKVFDPALRNQPVVVLTNNDGCICAVCPIARTFNIPKFKPYFQVKALLEQHNVVIRSSNYELYADLSQRMMNTIGQFCDNLHVYSIDEAFLHFLGYETQIKNWFDYGHTIRRTVWQQTKLPVGVGFGPSPTLAKAANHAAKKLAGFNGVAVIDSEQSRINILSQMAVADVWGVGRRLSKKLNLLGICSALDLANQTPRDMKRRFSVVLERTVNELNGLPNLGWDEVRANKQEIFSTRSFGERIYDAIALKTALINHASSVARSLRNQKLLANQLCIFAASSPHKDNRYKKSIVYHFPEPCADTQIFAQAITEVMPQIYQSGVPFYRCGVGAISLVSQSFIQPDLFTPRYDKPLLMKCLDQINNRYGANTLALASAKQTQRWHMKRAHLSPRFTTCWQQLPKIQC